MSDRERTMRPIVADDSYKTEQVDRDAGDPDANAGPLQPAAELPTRDHDT